MNDENDWDKMTQHEVEIRSIQSYSCIKMTNVVKK